MDRIFKVKLCREGRISCTLIGGQESPDLKLHFRALQYSTTQVVVLIIGPVRFELSS